MTVLVVFGTRPEAIKMCPLIKKLKNEKDIDCLVCLTGQHKEMLKQVMDAFEVKEDYNLDIMKQSQTLTSITTSILIKLEDIYKIVKPDLVLVHGDTTTSFAAALAAFYQKIPVGHVEAGLRSGNIYSPYPEELNRLLTDRISNIYFAPTENNKENLLHEGILDNVFVTGNTVIDAFQYTVQEDYNFLNEELNKLDYKKRIIVLTAHRRENLGDPLKSICKAVKRIALKYPDVFFVYPVHLNPIIKETVYEYLRDINNIKLINPIDVFDMHNLLARCFMVLTDSGGLQEEAPHFGKPVFVLRKETERPEAIEAGTVKIIGIEENDIFKEVTNILDNKTIYDNMAHAVNPYGDGHASDRICNIIKNFLYMYYYH